MRDRNGMPLMPGDRATFTWPCVNHRGHDMPVVVLGESSFEPGGIDVGLSADAVRRALADEVPHLDAALDELTASAQNAGLPEGSLIVVTATSRLKRIASSGAER